MQIFVKLLVLQFVVVCQIHPHLTFADIRHFCYDLRLPVSLVTSEKQIKVILMKQKWKRLQCVFGLDMFLMKTKAIFSSLERIVCLPSSLTNVGVVVKTKTKPVG